MPVFRSPIPQVHVRYCHHFVFITSSCLHSLTLNISIYFLQTTHQIRTTLGTHAILVDLNILLTSLLEGIISVIKLVIHVFQTHIARHVFKDNLRPCGQSLVEFINNFRGFFLVTLGRMVLSNVIFNDVMFQNLW